MRFPVGLIIFITCGIQGCAFVGPKPKVVVDPHCNTATQYYSLGAQDPSQQGPMILWNLNKYTVGDGECSGKECKSLLLAIGRQIAVETLLTVGYILSYNVVSEFNHYAQCTPDSLYESVNAQRSVVIEEDLTARHH